MFAILLVVIACILAITASARGATQSVYFHDSVHDELVAGAARNYEGCLTYAREPRTACRPAGEALVRRARTAIRALYTGTPTPNRRCTLQVYLPRQYAALGLFELAGRTKGPLNALRRLGRAYLLELRAEAAERTCVDRNRRR